MQILSIKIGKLQDFLYIRNIFNLNVNAIDANDTPVGSTSKYKRWKQQWCLSHNRNIIKKHKQ
ncbi:hypothetical protein GCM10019997_12680 [Prevotella corporis]